MFKKKKKKKLQDITDEYYRAHTKYLFSNLNIMPIHNRFMILTLILQMHPLSNSSEPEGKRAFTRFKWF